MRISDWSSDVCSSDLAGTTVTNAEGDTTKVGAGSISVADAAGNETAIGGTQVVVGGANPITISGDTGDITGLSNRDLNAADLDRKNVVSGKSVSVSVDLGGRPHINKKKNIQTK